MKEILSVRSLCFSYNGIPTLSAISFDVVAGEFLGILGPNGAGKSTLLRLLLGILTPQEGEIRLLGSPLRTLTRREVARRAAFLPQTGGTDFPFRVEEIVAMGRTPHLSRFQSEGPQDRLMIHRALEMTETSPMSQRRIFEISGGERQRVFLARAFAQATPLLVLDEPVASLDLLHTFQLMDLVRSQVKGGSAAVAALHDINLAARICDKILVMEQGRIVAFGRPGEILTAELLERVFGVKGHVTQEISTGRITIALLGPVERGDEKASC